MVRLLSGGWNRSQSRSRLWSQGRPLTACCLCLCFLELQATAASKWFALLVTLSGGCGSHSPAVLRPADRAACRSTAGSSRGRRRPASRPSRARPHRSLHRFRAARAVSGEVAQRRAALLLHHRNPAVRPHRSNHRLDPARGRDRRSMKCGSRGGTLSCAATPKTTAPRSPSGVVIASPCRLGSASGSLPALSVRWGVGVMQAHTRRTSLHQAAPSSACAASQF